MHIRVGNGRKPRERELADRERRERRVRANVCVALKRRGERADLGENSAAAGQWRETAIGLYGRLAQPQATAHHTRCLTHSPTHAHTQAHPHTGPSLTEPRRGCWTRLPFAVAALESEAGMRHRGGPLLLKDSRRLQSKRPNWR